MKEKLQKLISSENNIVESEKKRDELKRELYNELHLRFSALNFRKDHYSFYQLNAFNESSIRSEIMITFKSLLKTSKIQEISISYPRFLIKSIYLTCKHGLKKPRAWNGLDILSCWSRQDDKFFFESNGRLWTEDENGIKTSELRLDQLGGRKVIHQDKFKSLLSFLSRGFKLKADYDSLNSLNSSEGEKIVSYLRDLRDFSRTSEFELVITGLEPLQVWYDNYVLKKKDLETRLEKLEEDLKEFNRPFKLLLVLKKN